MGVDFYRCESCDRQLCDADDEPQYGSCSKCGEKICYDCLINKDRLPPHNNMEDLLDDNAGFPVTSCPLCRKPLTTKKSSTRRKPLTTKKSSTRRKPLTTKKTSTYTHGPEEWKNMLDEHDCTCHFILYPDPKNEEDKLYLLFEWGDTAAILNMSSFLSRNPNYDANKDSNGFFVIKYIYEQDESPGLQLDEKAIKSLIEDAMENEDTYGLFSID